MNSESLERQLADNFRTDEFPSTTYQCKICGAAVAQIQVEMRNPTTGAISYAWHDGRVDHLRWHREFEARLGPLSGPAPGGP